MVAETIKPGGVTPILRIFDVEKAKQFYVDYLGLEVKWEHRFEDGMPLYMEVASGGCRLHLSEHHGDACPGSAIRVEIDDVRAYHAQLAAKNYAYLRPGVEITPWNALEMRVIDPFGNRITFTQPV